MRRPALIIFFVLSLNSAYLMAQSYSSVHYDTKDGLPSETVYDITQDEDGFIWFGTENGLCRFDGKNFKTYTTKNGLPDNSILRVYGDNSGRLYFTPFTHTLHYFENDSFHEFPIPEKYKLDLSNIGNFIKKGTQILVGGIEEAYILDGDHLISLVDKYGMHLKSIKIVGIYDTVIVARSNSGDTIFYLPDSGAVRFQASDVKYDPGTVFDQNGIQRRLNIGKRSSFTVREFFRNNLLYEYYDNYVNIYDMSTGLLTHKIRVEKLSDVYIDTEDNLWISTLGSGVYRFPSFSFRNINFDSESEIFSLLQYDQQLLAGTDYSKMYVIPFNDSGSSYSTTNFSKLIASSGNTTSQTTKRNRIYALRSEGKDLYIGTDAFLLKKTGTSAPVFRNIFPVKDIDVMGDQLLVCTGYNVLILDRHTMSVKDTLLGQRATCGITYKGDYYIGTLGGLIKINSSKKITALNKSFPAFSKRIMSLKRGMNDDIWVATSGSGLVNFKNDQIIEILKEADGLTSDICTSLFVDSNLVWLGTNNGLNRIEIGNEKRGITRFTTANGLGADFINSVVATDSNVYVGTAAGLTIFGKKTFMEKSICLLHILQVSANNKELKNQTHYTFPYNTQNIQIDFTAVSFKSAGDITYYYELEGLDKDWNKTSANFVNFSTLQAGTYTLRLKAVNKFLVESEIKSVVFTIEPAWWQTLFFRIIVLTALGLLVLLVYRYNIRNIKRKEEAKREIDIRFAALEQNALQAQMNPHFIFNALNSIQTFILNLDAEGANNYLTSFASLIRQTLDNSMQPLITIASEIKYLETYLSLEKLRFREKFSYEIHIDESIDQNNTMLPGMLLQPYIENSLRHGIQHRKDNNGLILLAINKTADNGVLYTITDNGVGRKKAQELKSSRHIEYQSRGISINEKRVAAINSQFRTNIRVDTQDMVDENGTGTGTVVSVLIPRFINN